MEKKITKKEKFTQIKDILTQNGYTELAECMTHEIELLNKKSTSKKMTATQIENEELKDKIVSILEVNEKGMTASEVLAASEDFAGMSNQKITSLLTQLVNAKTIDKVKDGKKSLFVAKVVA